MKVFTWMDLEHNEIRNALIHPLSSPPDNPKEGQVYYDSSLHELRMFDGESWGSCGKTDITADSITSALGYTPADESNFPAIDDSTKGKFLTNDGVGAQWANTSEIFFIMLDGKGGLTKTYAEIVEAYEAGKLVVLSNNGQFLIGEYNGYSDSDIVFYGINIYNGALAVYRIILSSSDEITDDGVHALTDNNISTVIDSSQLTDYNVPSTQATYNFVKDRTNPFIVVDYTTESQLYNDIQNHLWSDVDGEYKACLIVKKDYESLTFLPVTRTSLVSSGGRLLYGYAIGDSVYSYVAENSVYRTSVTLTPIPGLSSLNIKGASVGQIIKVAEVASDGVPIKWEAVNDRLPSVTPSEDGMILGVEQVGEFEYGYGFKQMPTIRDFVDLGITDAAPGQVAAVASVDYAGRPMWWTVTDLPDDVFVVNFTTTGGPDVNSDVRPVS